MQLATEHMNLIRGIAWSFHRTTGIEFNELFSEAALAYCEAIKDYKPSSAKFTTYAYSCMRNKLINFIGTNSKNKLRHIEDTQEEQDGETYPEYYKKIAVWQPMFFELYDRFSEQAKTVVDFILIDPYPFLGFAACRNGTRAEGVLYKELRKHNWQSKNIWSAFTEIKRVLRD